MLFFYFLAFVPVLCAFVLYTYGSLKLTKLDSQAVKDFLVDTLEDGAKVPLVIGHRGAHFEAPENTLEAMRTALHNGAKAVELDLDFTRDKIPIIIHDDTLDRTTDGIGLVANVTYEEVRKLNAAAKAKKLYYKNGTVAESSFERIPTLEEVVKFSLETGMKIILDVKSNPEMSGNALKGLAEMDERVYDHVMVTSFYPEIIYYVRKADPNYLTALIWRYNFASRTIAWQPKQTGIYQLFLEVIDAVGFYTIHTWLPDFLGVSAVSMHKDHMSRRYLRQWRKRNIEVMAWTVNDPTEKNYFLNYLKIPIITDSILDRQNCPEQTF